MALQVQVHITVPKPPPGVDYSREFLDRVADDWIHYRPIPKGVKVTALSWRTRESAPFYKEARASKVQQARASFSAIQGFRSVAV